MQVLITGANRSTLSRLKSYLTTHGHEATIAIDGLECQVGLGKFLPDLIVMELDFTWRGYDGVMATLIGDPVLNEIPVVFFTDHGKQISLETSPRVIVRLKHPSQPSELYKLRDLLDNMELARGGILLSPEHNDECTVVGERAVS